MDDRDGIVIGMTTVSVQVPDSLLLQTNGSVEELAAQSQFLLALKFFELGRLTSGQAAQMCSMNRVDFLLQAGRAGIPVSDLNETELAQEIQNADRA